jgi:PAS domain S-box-containing protein
MKSTVRGTASAVLCTDAGGLVTLCNPAAGELLGLPAEDVVGRPADAFIPGFALLLRRFAAGREREMAAGIDGTLLAHRHGGGIVSVRAVLSRVRAGSDEIFTAVLEEIVTVAADGDDDIDWIPLGPPAHPAR